MAYSIENCFKDLEKLLNRPLNSFEFQYVNTWFDNYPSDFINACLEMCKGRVVYKVSYISTILYQHYPFYQAYMKVNGVEEATPIITTPKIEETKPIEKENVNKEVLDKFMALMDDED